MIRLIHTENNGKLAVDRPLVTKSTEAFLRVYEGKFKEENDSVNSIWEIEATQNSIRGNVCKLKSSSKDSQR